jgi:uncharacterized membrane-anchored protein YjiN (DUF445 family)
MNPTEAALARRLHRMQWLATGLLLAMGAVFALTSVLLPSYPWLGVVRAFAEAGMIGALADWFAVTALFRRPLGLPIPHTAIVPSRKNDIGRALARFIRDHFLVEEAVTARLSRVDLAARLGAWLERDGSARMVSRDLGVALNWLLGAVDSAELRASVRHSLADALDRAPVSSVLAVALDVLTSGSHAQALIDQLVQFGRDQLEGNQDRIRRRIKERSPWWLPNFVDEEIYDQLVSELERILEEIGENPEHPARNEFNARLRRLRHSLEGDPVLIEKGQVLKDEFLNHPAVNAYFAELWSRVLEFLREALTDPGSALRLGVETELQLIGERLRCDPQVSERLDRWLRDLIVYLVENYRQQISEIISETVEQWDPTATAERIELHIGRDLQFIRINGTLVGGLVGVAIYTVWGALPI